MIGDLFAAAIDVIGDLFAAAIDVIGDLFARYYNLLTAASWAMLVPQLQHDWLAPFREPWIRPE